MPQAKSTFVTAKKIHNGYDWMPDDTIIELTGSGAIVSVFNGPHPEAVFYDGILAPGFVNAHCHLELSHLKGIVPEHTGLIPFLKTIPLHRNDFSEDQKREARLSASDELIANGVVAVGDIANTTDTLDLRASGKLHVHTFVEAIGFLDANAGKSFGYAVQSYNAFADQWQDDKLLRQSIVPHAPYSVSASLLKLIDAHNYNGIISIHNQESNDENLFFIDKTGAIPDLLHALGIDDNSFKRSGKSSLQTYLEYFTPAHPVIFVHNTFTSAVDVAYARNHIDEHFWCLCPNANLYIENRLPDIGMLIQEGVSLCIGTDSLASNHQLCILSELYTIKQYHSMLG